MDEGEDVTGRKVLRGRIGLGIALAAGIGLLAGCESSEEKAQKHYQSGLALLEQGDVSRAMVEFRNVFALDGSHEAARETYARLVREQGNVREAYSQYLRLVEQHPNNLGARKALAEMALDAGNWEEAERNGRAALTLDPNDPGNQAIGAMLDYRVALQSRDEAARNRALDAARAVLNAHPEQDVARRVVMDAYVRNSDWESVLTTLDDGLKLEPNSAEWQRMRAAALFQLGRTDELEAQLRQMAAAHPADQEIETSLLALLVNQKRPEAAEEFLRGRIDPASADPLARQRLIAFIAQTRGLPAARQELDRIIASNPPEPGTYRTMRAGIDFDAGDHNGAMAEMQSIIDSKPGPAVLNQARVTLARMMAQTGNKVGGRALVEEVLAADATNVDALKLKANWLIDDDKTGDALVALRSALEYAPRDPQVMTLMARAHERDGSRDLMGEMLSQAVVASNRAPAESLRYAAFLEQDGKHLPAEDALVNALRLQPRNVDLLSALGRVYVAMKDWPRADHVVRTLKEIGTDQAVSSANEITANRLAALNQDQELASFLRGLAAEGDSGPGVELALIRTSLLRGDTQEAMRQAEALLAKAPDNPTALYLHAAVLLSAGQGDKGLEEMRALTQAHPDFEMGWAALHNALLSRKDTQGASAALEAGLAAIPMAPTLSWIKAGVLEKSGDIDGAIKLYEGMYERDSNSPIIANNLASLLATYRDDDASLDRAYTVARRLRGTTVPAFQDTYGWIAYRRGNYDEALGNLEPAARGLPQDDMVQSHLGLTYAALGRKDQALAILQPLVAKDDLAAPPAYMDRLKAEVARLTAPPAGAAPGAPPPEAGGTATTGQTGN